MDYSNLQPFAILLIVLLLLLAGHKWFRFGKLGDGPWRLLLELKRRVVVVLIRGMHEISRFGVLGDQLSRGLDELKRHVPVYSAESVAGREAEFIRDELPKTPVRSLLVGIALLVLLVVAWWLTR